VVLPEKGNEYTYILETVALTQPSEKQEKITPAFLNLTHTMILDVQFGLMKHIQELQFL
jgi:hypothetical protein